MWEHLKRYFSYQQHMKLNPMLCGWVSSILESGDPVSWETEEFNV